ncbi:hypothetical protein DL96DRAFT_440805 [Flagelloscypha sp. PMI_526]|nr:hypothetical protein DL96DRAFT_440805 [Flagelloscypha sp. PMI_526]
MSIHAPSPSKPSPHRPSGHARRPSLSEVLLRDIVDRDDHRRGIHSSASSSKSEYEPQSRHRRRHSTSMHVPRSITPHTPTTPHGQVLQARLERVLHTASISSSSAESHKSPLFRSHSSSGHKRRTMSSRFEDDKAAPLTLHDKVAAWNLPSAPQLEGIEPVTTPPRRKRHSMFNTPPRLALQRPSLTASPRLHPSTPRSPSYGHHPPPASPFLRSTSPRLLLTTPPPTPPESPTEETSASDSSSSSTPPSESFDPHLASLQCRNMTGYVSFGEVEGLDAGRLCDGDIELKKGVQKGAWSWRLWS